MEQHQTMFLTKSEKQELTGYTHHERQCRRLEELGIPFLSGRDGEPLVLRDAIEQRMGLRSTHSRPASKPDLTALQSLQDGT